MAGARRSLELHLEERIPRARRRRRRRRGGGRGHPRAAASSRGPTACTATEALVVQAALEPAWMIGWLPVPRHQMGGRTHARTHARAHTHPRTHAPAAPPVPFPLLDLHAARPVRLPERPRPRAPDRRPASRAGFPSCRALRTHENSSCCDSAHASPPMQVGKTRRRGPSVTMRSAPQLKVTPQHITAAMQHGQLVRAFRRQTGHLLVRNALSRLDFLIFEIVAAILLPSTDQYPRRPPARSRNSLCPPSSTKIHLVVNVK